MANGTGRAKNPYTHRDYKDKNYWAIDEKETSSLVDAILGDGGNTMTHTENGALTYKSTGDSLLNFFSLAGAVRDRSEQDVIELFRKAWREDANLAMKMLFYFRDIRGGQGERKLFRTIISFIAKQGAKSLSIHRNFSHIPEMGRWDDFFGL